jgi:hypothetical protein
MMVSMLANSEKLVSTDKRETYDKNAYKNDMFAHNNQTEHAEQHDSRNYSQKQKDVQSEQPYKPSANIFENIGGNNQEHKTHASDDAELKVQKLNMLRKLGELSGCGVKLSQKYTMNSDLQTMTYEYELHRQIRAKKNGINWMMNMFTNCIIGIEFMNEKYNPFDFKLTGWSDAINSDISSYHEVFGELYEKYMKNNGSGFSPEIRFLFMIIFSAIGCHVSYKLNEMFVNKSDNNNIEELRRKANVDNINKKNETIDSKAALEHDGVMQRMQDIEIIKQHERESLKKQEEQRMKQSKLNELKNSLQRNFNDNQQDERHKQDNPKPNLQTNFPNMQFSVKPTTQSTMQSTMQSTIQPTQQNVQTTIRPPTISSNMEKIFGKQNIFDSTLQHMNSDDNSTSENHKHSNAIDQMKSLLQSEYANTNDSDMNKLNKKDKNDDEIKIEKDDVSSFSGKKTTNKKGNRVLRIR